MAVAESTQRASARGVERDLARGRVHVHELHDAQVVERADDATSAPRRPRATRSPPRAPPAAPRASRRSPTVGGMPASENISEQHHEGVPLRLLVEALEVVELLGLEARARQQQDHAEGAERHQHVGDRRRTSPSCSRCRCRRGCRAARSPCARWSSRRACASGSSARSRRRCRAPSRAPPARSASAASRAVMPCRPLASSRR